MGAGRVAQPLRHPRFPQQVAEHQQADQRRHGGHGRATISVEMTGNSMTVVLETGLACFMSMARSFFVVSRRMTGGWMIGTSDM